MELWHVSLATADRMPLFPTEPLRRRAVRTLARVAGASLALFCLVDEHLHLVAVAGRRQLRRLRQALHQALSPVAAAALAASWAGRVQDRKHLLALVRYHLTQVRKHGVQGTHPALWSGSCFQDLIGARRVAGLQLRLAPLLPRQPLPALACELVGLQRFRPRPIALPVVRELGIVRVRAAASAAVAAAPELSGNARETVLARGVAAQLARLALIPRSEIRWGLGLTRQGLCGALARAVAPAFLDAARRRLALEVALAQNEQTAST